jgi:ribosomal protein S12 methylthiotransferase
MLGRLQQAGWSITPEPSEAETIVINTCSFIESAVDESVDTILELAKYKSRGSCRRLIVAGCLPQRYQEEIAESLPEVDVFLGTGAYDQVVEAVMATSGRQRCFLNDPNELALQRFDDLRVATAPYVSYLKIAEGCNRHCTYCIIPRLRGGQRSRPLEDVLAEARSLINTGTRELIMVAQESTAYGRDLNPSAGLGDLLKRVAQISSKTWIRFLYGHPESLDTEVLRAVADRLNICSYFDIPVQHASDPVLKKMGRDYTRDKLLQLFGRIRELVPEAALRTTLMVGFPGETDQDFKQLVDFIETVQFDHLGVFVYSDSEDLPAHTLSGHVPPKIAQKRYDQLMASQVRISLEKNRNHIGCHYVILVEKQNTDGTYIGRTMFQAPEVDGLTYVQGEQLEIGSFYQIAVKDALEYDLIGKVV